MTARIDALADGLKDYIRKWNSLSDDERKAVRNHDKDLFHARICAKCDQPFAPGEPVVHQFSSRPGFFGGRSRTLGIVCAPCSKFNSDYEETPFCDFECKNCGRTFYAQLSGARSFSYCSNGCRYLVELKLQRDKRHAKRRPVTCAACNKEFIPRRTDATTCSNACRQWLHRARHRNGY